MKNIKKADLQTFLNKTERMLLDANYRRTVESDKSMTYEWTKQTEWGTLLLNPCNDYPSSVYSIFGRFADISRANEILLLFGGNTYSGKCNIHTFESEIAIDQLKQLISAVN